MLQRWSENYNHFMNLAVYLKAIISWLGMVKGKGRIKKQKERNKKSGGETEVWIRAEYGRRTNNINTNESKPGIYQRQEPEYGRGTNNINTNESISGLYQGKELEYGRGINNINSNESIPAIYQR